MEFVVTGVGWSAGSLDVVVGGGGVELVEVIQAEPFQYCPEEHEP